MNEQVVNVHEFSVSGLRTRVLEIGDHASAEAVVLLHGNPGTAEDWAELLPALAPLGRIVAFDLPGYGMADRPRTWDYSALGYAEFMGEALAELGVSRAHLVMHDLGGVGVLWGAANPERFASAVLIDTGSLIGFRWHPFARAYRAPVLGEALATILSPRLLSRGLRRLESQPHRLPAAAITRMAASFDRGTRLAAMRFYRATPAEAMGALAPVLRELDRPALVIWGRHDPFVPVEQAALQRESFPSAEVVIFEDSGHWPHIDNPERAAAAIVPFLSQQLTEMAQREQA